MAENADYHYSVTIHTDSLAILYCLRGLSMFAQKTGNVYKPWGAASKAQWLGHHHIVKFYFTTEQYRSDFEEAANDILAGRWIKVGDSVDDPLSQ
jgi:hypothetical protein